MDEFDFIWTIRILIKGDAGIVSELKIIREKNQET